MTDKQTTNAEQFINQFKSQAKGKAVDVATKWPDAHNFDINPTLEGTVTAKETCFIDGEERQRMTVKSGDVEVSLWHSAGLSTLFNEANLGDRIAVAFTGFEPLGNNKKLRTFQVARIPA